MKVTTKQMECLQFLKTYGSGRVLNSYLHEGSMKALIKKGAVIIENNLSYTLTEEGVKFLEDQK